VSPSWWNPITSGSIKLAIAASALLVAGWAEWARRARNPDLCGQQWRARLLAVLGLLGFLAYFNFGSFHFGGIYVHLWDSAHYVLGARYFDELGYDGLYECMAVADAQGLGDAPRVSRRLIIDLRTNHLTTAAEAVAHPERCKARFSAQRWAAFRADVDFFRSEFPDADWERMFTDHGFNAPPAWLLLAHPLAGKAPLTWTRLRMLAAIDPVLILGSLIVVVWAFGGWTASLVAVVFGTYFPGQLWWTGGSFLRWDWLAALLIGLALCRRARPVAGGALLGYAAMLRVFPGFALVGVATAVVLARLRRRPFDPAAGRVLLGALAVTVVLGPLSGALRRDHAWLDFAHNLRKHTSVASGNRMGLATMLAYDAQARRAALHPVQGEDTRTRWERAQAETLQRRRWLWVSLAALGTLAVVTCLREQPAWVTAVLGLLLVPLGTPLACYYYVFVAALALLTEFRGEVGGLLIALAVASGVVARLSHYEMDEQYAAQSLIALIAFAFVVSAFLSRRTAISTSALGRT